MKNAVEGINYVLLLKPSKRINRASSPIGISGIVQTATRCPARLLIFGFPAILFSLLHPSICNYLRQNVHESNLLYLPYVTHPTHLALSRLTLPF